MLLDQRLIATLGINDRPSFCKWAREMGSRFWIFKDPDHPYFLEQHLKKYPFSEVCSGLKQALQIHNQAQHLSSRSEKCLTQTEIC